MSSSSAAAIAPLRISLPRSQKLLLLESPEQWQTVLPELAEETYLPAEHLPLQSYLSRS